MESYICTICDNDISENMDFCPYCGNLFLEDAKCINHKDIPGIGVCLICEEPMCNECGGYVNEKFLCTLHENYEIYEGMAKVYGSSDAVHCNYLADLLKQDNIQALVYSRKVSPISIGGGEYSLFRASGEYKGHLINEFKVMAPLGDVLKAEKIIKDIDEPDPKENNESNIE